LRSLRRKAFTIYGSSAIVQRLWCVLSHIENSLSPFSTIKLDLRGGVDEDEYMSRISLPGPDELDGFEREFDTD
jgi:hypothetical protein